MIIIFVGFSPRKVSREFLCLLRKRISRHEFYYFMKINSFVEFLKTIKEEFCVLPIYCEDDALTKAINKIDFAVSIEEVCRPYENARILHPSFWGKVLGNKMETNLVLSSLGIRMPELINVNDKQKMLFINDLSDSGSETSVSIMPQEFKYNTRFIKSVYKFRGKNYYFCPRALCVGGKINEIYLRFRPASDKNPNVHGKQTPMDADLHNSCYDNLIKPNLPQLEDICHKLGEHLGLGFYAHDFLLENGSNLFYLTETAFRFDNKMWKKMSKSITNDLSFEIPLSESIERSFCIFEDALDSIKI